MKEQSKKLTYRNLERDIERRCIKTDETQMGIPVFRGYDQAHREVFNTYIEKKLFSLVVDYLLAQNWEWGTNDYFEQANAALLSDRDITSLKRLWNGVIASQEQNFWATHSVTKSSPDNARVLRKAKEAALTHMMRYREILDQLGDHIEIVTLDRRMSQIKKGKRFTKIKPYESRKMDTDLFWEMIEISRQAAESTPEQIMILGDDLENLEPNEIIRFQEFLDEKLCDAYTWDVWALAYIAQDGCSDDEFEYFRAWLILQGRTLFKSTVEDIHNVLDDIPAGLGTRAEGFLNLTGSIYQSQTGKNLPAGKQSPCDLKGTAWKEEKLGILYPKLWEHYEFD